VRFALISDAHFGKNAYHAGKLRKLTQFAEPLSRQFVEQMNQLERPDWVVNLGDVIEDENRRVDLEQYGRFISVLDKLSAPIVHVAGNHDSVNLSDDDLRSLWRHSGPLYYSRNFDDLHVVVLRTVHAGGRITLPTEQLRWLENDLSATALRTIVFMHHPASEMLLEGNRWFEKAPNICRVAERRRVREILESSGKVIAVFNGHVHWNHLDIIGGIPYVTLQSLIENIDDDAPGRAAATWAVCDLVSHRLIVRVLGEQPARYQLELPRH
jgi:3',5'-cyclic AMP phosphodiesterase CpdA